MNEGDRPLASSRCVPPMLPRCSPGEARTARLLPKAFFRRPVEVVARELLGHHHVRLRVLETEAYGGPQDSASHCRFGRTARNAHMWEEGGRAYIYLCYGLQHMLNIVTGEVGQGEAVLIRGCEVLAGLELVRERRGGTRGCPLLDGPGKVAQALGLDLSFNGHLMYQRGGLELRRGDPPAGILEGPRGGVGYASIQDREAPLRFLLR